MKGWSKNMENKINELLNHYKKLINFKDNMEKNNFKFVTQYVKREKRLNPNYETDTISFLEDLIDVHTHYLKSRNFEI